MNAPTAIKPLLGRLLAGVRITAKLRQVDLAKALETTDDWISCVENGHAVITVPKLVAWCRACGADPADVLQRSAEYESPAVGA